MLELSGHPCMSKFEMQSSLLHRHELKGFVSERKKRSTIHEVCEGMDRAVRTFCRLVERLVGEDFTRLRCLSFSLQYGCDNESFLFFDTRGTYRKTYKCMKHKSI